MNKLNLTTIVRSINYIASRNIALSNFKRNEMQESKTQDWKIAVQSSMKVFPNFVSEEEEKALLEELEPHVKRLRYEQSHWDDAIHSYREMERNRWNEKNMEIINRIRKKAFPPGAPLIGPVHVLDIADDGWIKPHVDSVRFCGEVIAGLSLLSDSIMRLTMVGREQERVEDFLLPRRSLYIMSGTARYDYNHEILKAEESYYQGKLIERKRRISVICRIEPKRDS